MKTAVIVFPASNCDRDAHDAILQVTGTPPQMVWHGDSEVPDADLIVLPGGFSYGDYLRCGAMAAHSRIMRDVMRKAEQGVAVLGVCNGFQILTEAGMLPGALMRNAGLKFVCREVELLVDESQSAFRAIIARANAYAFRSRMAKVIILPTKMCWTASKARGVSHSAMRKAITQTGPRAILQAF